MEPLPIGKVNDITDNSLELEEGRTPSSELKVKTLGHFSTNKLVQIKNSNEKLMTQSDNKMLYARVCC